ncbi:MAG: hypothetical protein AAF138_00145 [Planctomycetota bacterium]
MRIVCWFLLLIGVGSGAGSGVGCAATPESRTTRLQAADVLGAADDVREQLAQSDFLAQRGATSPEMVLLPTIATNRSDDRLTDGERWMVTAGVARAPAVLGLMREKNIAVQAPPTAAGFLEQYGIDPGAHDRANLPTHLFTAEVASIARAAATGLSSDARALDERRDTYFVRYEIVEATGRRVLWNGSAELARRATGLLID